MQTLIACFSGGILKQATYVFRSNAEQSRLTALKNKSENVRDTCTLTRAFAFIFFAQNSENVQTISELYCMREVVPVTLPA